jgi:hypothetical protein
MVYGEVEQEKENKSYRRTVSLNSICSPTIQSTECPGMREFMCPKRKTYSTMRGDLHKLSELTRYLSG